MTKGIKKIYGFICTLALLVGGGLFTGKSVPVKAEEVESHLTVLEGTATTTQLGYINQKFVGTTSLEIEATLGEAAERAMGFGYIKPNNTASGLEGHTYRASSFDDRMIDFGPWKNGVTYFKKINTTSEQLFPWTTSPYDDKASATSCFGAKTTFKIEVNADGDVEISARLTEDKATYLAYNAQTTEAVYEALASDYVQIATLENFYDAEMITDGYFIGFFFNTEKVVEEMKIHKILVRNSANKVLFADNFYYFPANAEENNAKGKYFLASTTIRSALGTSWVVTRGEEYPLPTIDLSAIEGEVYKGQTYALTPSLRNFPEGSAVSISVAKQGGAPVVLQSGDYVFEEVGAYTVYYTCQDVSEQLEIFCKNKSTQPTVEESFEEEYGTQCVAQGATVAGGRLLLAASENNVGSFLTKNYVENFILTVKVNALQGSISFVYNLYGGKDCRITLTNTGACYIDEQGVQTVVALEEDIYTACGAEDGVVFRLEKLGNSLTFSADSSISSNDEIHVPLWSATLPAEQAVGQVGVVVNEGTASIDSFQLVNMTSFVNENTTTTVPNREDEEGEGDAEEPNDKGCKGCKSSLQGIGISSLLLLAGVATRRRRK